MVKWSNIAKDDLKKIYDYISQDSVIYAKNVSKTIVFESKKLSLVPNVGRVVPELNNPNIREIFIYSYRLIYQLKGKNVEVLTILHGKRDFSPKMISITKI